MGIYSIDMPSWSMSRYWPEYLLVLLLQRLKPSFKSKLLTFVLTALPQRLKRLSAMLSLRSTFMKHGDDATDPVCLRAVTFLFFFSLSCLCVGKGTSVDTVIETSYTLCNLFLSTVFFPYRFVSSDPNIRYLCVAQCPKSGC